MQVMQPFPSSLTPGKSQARCYLCTGFPFKKLSFGRPWHLCQHPWVWHPGFCRRHFFISFFFKPNAVPQVHNIAAYCGRSLPTLPKVDQESTSQANFNMHFGRHSQCNHQWVWHPGFCRRHFFISFFFKPNAVPQVHNIAAYCGGSLPTLPKVDQESTSQANFNMHFGRHSQCNHQWVWHPGFCRRHFFISFFFKPNAVPQVHNIAAYCGGSLPTLPKVDQESTSQANFNMHFGRHSQCNHQWVWHPGFCRRHFFSNQLLSPQVHIDCGGSLLTLPKVDQGSTSQANFNMYVLQAQPMQSSMSLTPGLLSQAHFFKPTAVLSSPHWLRRKFADLAKVDQGSTSQANLNMHIAGTANAIINEFDTRAVAAGQLLLLQLISFLLDSFLYGGVLTFLASICLTPVQSQALPSSTSLTPGLFGQAFVLFCFIQWIAFDALSRRWHPSPHQRV